VITDNEALDAALHSAGVALTALQCDYLRQRGDRRCIGGCWQEPMCATDEPAEGWETQLLQSAAEVFTEKRRQ
jgi:hypothetical protein